MSKQSVKAVRNDDYRNSQMCIVTGPNIDLNYMSHLIHLIYVNPNSNIVYVTNDRISGVYDNISSTLIFVRIMNPSSSTANQVFTGCLVGTDNEIAGFFEALPPAGGTAHRSIFGWFGIG